jgi:hypothetical protein
MEEFSTNVSRRRKQRPRTHCRRGHELVGNNAVTEKSGRRRCRTCRNRISRDWAAKNPEKLIATQRKYRANHIDQSRARWRYDGRLYKERHKDKLREIRLRPEEKAKRNERARRYYSENSTIVLERYKAWLVQRPGYRKQKRREAYLRNSGKLRRQAKASAQRNKETVQKYQKAYRKRNAASIREKTRSWKSRNIDRVRQYGVEGQARRRARKLALAATFGAPDWERCLAYWSNACAICGREADLFTFIARDHWIPIASPNCPGHIPENVLPLCHTRPGGITGCNNIKSNFDPVDWLMSRLGPEAGAAKLAQIEAYFASVRQVAPAPV